MPEMIVSSRKPVEALGECDPADIVFYPNHFSVVGLSKPELIEQLDVLGFPMVDTRENFHRPSKFGDEVEIKIQITEFGNSSFSVEHNEINKGELAVKGFEKRVLVKKKENGSGITSCPIPAVVKEKFEI